TCDSVGVERCRIDVHSVAGAKNVYSQKTESKREGRNNFKVDKRFRADASNLFHIAHVGDANNDRGKNNGCQGHVDELDEAVAKGLERDSEVRKELSDDDAEHDADEDLQ